MNRFARSILCGILATQICLPSHALANEWIALHLYQLVELSDLIAFGTIIDSDHAVVRVDEILKGTSDRSIVLVEIVDPFARSEDQKPMVNGTRELLFLHRQSGGYAPLQILSGRWRIDGEHFRPRDRVPGQSVAAYRLKIHQLIRLQSDAGAPGEKAIDAFVAGLRSDDPDIRTWAAQKASATVTKPSDRLLDAFLEQWRVDGEVRGAAANLIIQWRARQAAPMLADRLRQGAVEERVAAVRALGGTGDRSYLELIRSVAASDPSDLVRAGAYEGLAELLGADSLDDLRRGAVDPAPGVRGAIPIHAYNLQRRLDRNDVRGSLRLLVERLREDPVASVSGNARHVLALWDKG